MTQVRLSSKWTQPMDKEQAEKFKDILLADTLVLGRLYAIIEEFEAELDRNDTSIDEYSSPAWAYLKADRTGERRGLLKIKSLLQFLKD